MNKKTVRLSVQAGTLSIIINSILFIIKFWAGLSIHSIALISDAWHTLSDSITSIIVIVGTKISLKPPDKEHPFGHGRAELISSIIIAFFLGAIALKFLEVSVGKFFSQEKTVFSQSSIIVVIISILLKEGIAQFSFYCYRKTKMQSLKADGWHHRSDALSSLILLVGIIFGKHFWWIDSFLGIIVSIMIAITAYKIFQEAVSPLIGKSPSQEIINQINLISSNISNCATSPHHYHIHDYGYHKELTFHLRLPAETQLIKAHEIADKIEKKIKEQINIESTIHIEPIKNVVSMR